MQQKESLARGPNVTARWLRVRRVSGWVPGCSRVTAMDKTIFQSEEIKSSHHKEARKPTKVGAAACW